MWCHQESNRGHTDFQSVALPTELWYLFRFESANVLRFFGNKKFYDKKFPFFFIFQTKFS